jgi:hypothetical protein
MLNWNEVEAKHLGGLPRPRCFVAALLRMTYPCVLLDALKVSLPRCDLIPDIS